MNETADHRSKSKYDHSTACVWRKINIIISRKILEFKSSVGVGTYLVQKETRSTANSHGKEQCPFLHPSAAKGILSTTQHRMSTPLLCYRIDALKYLSPLWLKLHWLVHIIQRENHRSHLSDNFVFRLGYVPVYGIWNGCWESSFSYLFMFVQHHAIFIWKQDVLIYLKSVQPSIVHRRLSVPGLRCFRLLNCSFRVLSSFTKVLLPMSMQLLAFPCISASTHYVCDWMSMSNCWFKSLLIEPTFFGKMLVQQTPCLLDLFPYPCLGNVCSFTNCLQCMCISSPHFQQLFKTNSGMLTPGYTALNWSIYSLLFPVGNVIIIVLSVIGK